MTALSAIDRGLTNPSPESIRARPLRREVYNAKIAGFYSFIITGRFNLKFHQNISAMTERWIKGFKCLMGSGRGEAGAGVAK